MTTIHWRGGLGCVLMMASTLGISREALADEATVIVGERFAEAPSTSAPVAVDESERSRFEHPVRDRHRALFRLQLGPQGVTTGKSFGLGAGLGLDFGSGSVGGRIAASWLRGEGSNADGTSTATGNSIGVYSGEITLDLHERGPVHPVVGMGVGLLHVSRPDASGYAGIATGRLGLEYALGFDDADVRIGTSVTGGLVGPVDTEVKDLRAYALVGAHLAIGF